jgi:hypothetical protein
MLNDIQVEDYAEDIELLQKLTGYHMNTAGKFEL